MYGSSEFILNKDKNIHKSAIMRETSCFDAPAPKSPSQARYGREAGRQRGVPGSYDWKGCAMENFN